MGEGSEAIGQEARSLESGKDGAALACGSGARPAEQLAPQGVPEVTVKSVMVAQMAAQIRLL
eukprot:COSAG02_NODE_92_length_37588_cov_135.916242_35_plen_62_part_00